jgi:serine/threonine protein kinase
MGGPYGFGCDIWALGCIYYEIVVGTALFYDVAENDVVILKTILSALPEVIKEADIRHLYNADILTTHLKGRTLKHRTWKQVLKKSAGFVEQFPRYEDFLLLLGEMMKFVPEKRITTTAALQHPFLIPYREKIKSVTEKINIKGGVENKNLVVVQDGREKRLLRTLIFKLYERRGNITWYKPCMLFHTIDFFYRYLLFSSNRNHTDEGIVLRILTCLYLSIKYFTTIHTPISFPQLLEYYVDLYPYVEKFGHFPYLKEAEDFELYLIRDVFSYVIYRETLYEAADSFSYVLTEKDIENLLVIWTKMESIQGNTIQEVLDIYLDYSKKKSRKEPSN